MVPPQAFARTVPAAGGGYAPADSWQPLEEHLTAVAKQAAEFAQFVGVSDWAYLAGMWHDLGKYHQSFQAMLHEVAQGKPKRRVDHATAGAVHAEKLVRSALKSKGVEPLHLLLTATIAGHHTTLPDGVAELDSRLLEKSSLYRDVLREEPPGNILFPITKVPPLPSRLRQPIGGEWNLRVDFLTRMVFSAMVDADRLDAEGVMSRSLPEERRASTLRRTRPSIGSLRTAADRRIDEFVTKIQLDGMGPLEHRVHDYRQAVLAACRKAAEWAPGAFALDVATGGGKTLSSLSFGLRHAERHGKDRVIVVIPYTSIIEQTAREYRQALGELGGSVVEHHSALDEEYELRDGLPSFDMDAERRRLATENWDAPLIVTTAVQFFESLYACTPSRCRKLHNIANSVVILDEAQTLPPDLLAPTVWAMNELVEGYGVSLVLSTATQPALEPPFPTIMNLRPIIPPELPRPPARVRVEFKGKESLTWPSLAAEVAGLPQGLCITHQRRDARDLTREIDKVVGNQGTLHLSAGMCPAHRSQCIAEVRARLSRSLPCKVVSTQLVEAGVDLDFPVVYRALAGFDSLAQAAGRANREGRLGERGGILRVFRAPTAPPPGLPRLAKESAEVLLRAADLMGQEIDIFASENGRHYFRQYYSKIADKDRGIAAFRRDFRFQATAAAYRFIRDSGIAVIIPWGERGAQAVSDLEAYGPSRERLRRIQPYTVSVYRADLEALLAERAVVTMGGLGNHDAGAGLYVLRDISAYDPRFGLQVRETTAGDLII